MCFSFNKVQAANSIFSDINLTRDNLKAVAQANTLEENISVELKLEKSGYTDNDGKNIWKIVNQNRTDLDYYCLNMRRGFGGIEGIAENTSDTYSYSSNLNISDLNNYAYDTDISEETYNKILWILNNSYVRSNDEDFYSNIEYKNLMKKLVSYKNNNNAYGIYNDNKYNLTEDDIITAQKLAIWYYTNGYDVPGTRNPIGGVPSDPLKDNYGDVITYSRQEKLLALKDYFINNASSTYSPETPTLSLSDSNVKIEENENSYIVGPFLLTGTDTEQITEIVATLNKNFTLLDSSKKVVSNNSFSKVIGNDGFYLKFAKNDITENTTVTLDIQYKYNVKILTFMTDTSDPTNTQPVVLVKNEEIIKNINASADINLTEILVEKVWSDNENQDGLRPESIEVQLYKDEIAYGDSITLSGTDLTYTWNNLLYGHTYTVKELNSNNIAVENGQAYNDDYTASYVIDGNKTTITNTHIPETISKTVVKIWDDNNNQDRLRTDTIKITLYKTVNQVKQKVEDVELNVSNSWKYTWNNLNKYEDGKEIIYTVEESVPNHYTASYSKDTFTITNSYTPGTISKTIIKQWNDQDNIDGIRPDNVTVQLYKNGEKYGDEVVLNKENGFTYTWTSLPEKENGVAINYTVSEIKIGDDNVENESAAGYKVEYKIEGNTITATNIHAPEKTSKTVTKVWNDNDNKNDTRPNSIKIQLYANGEKYGEPITLTSGTDKIWQIEELSYVWTDLPLNKDGEEITYTVKELDSAGNVIEEGKMYDNKYVTTYSEDTFTITNTYKKFDLALRKFITKVNDESYSREPVVDTSTISTKGTATYKHIKQPVAVQKGDIITYTIRVYNEGELDGYVNEITDYLPDNLIPIIDGVEGIDSEKYKEEIEFNMNWLWEYSDNGKTVKTQITKFDKATNLPNIEEDKQDDARLLKAYVKGSDDLDYIDVQIKCLVTDKAVSEDYLTNIAEITEAQDINGIKGDGSDSKVANADTSNLADYKNEEAINSTKDSYIPGQEDDDDFEKLVVKEFDLALRKFITKVNETSYSRQPVVDTSKLGTTIDGKTITTAIYNHSKEPVIVETNNIVTYKIRIYNEGTIAGYANEITDDIPEGLEYLPNSSVNVSYKWKMLDSEGNETEDVSKAVMIVTDYLSDSDKNNIINAVSEENGVKTLSYKDVEVQFKVIAKAEKLKDNVIKNVAQISADSDRDIDSTPNRDEKYDYTTGNNEDDIDYEPIKLQYFDLALRKFVTKVNSVDYNNRYPEIIYNDDESITYKQTKDPVLVTTNDVVIYTIRVYNEGEKSGYATEITDSLPEGLEFIADNEINKQYGWKLIDSDGNETTDITKAVKFTTDYLKNELIDSLVVENGQKILSYKDIQIAFKVTESNMSDRILINIAEISKDSDDDVDSTPGNNDLTEDDIDREYVKVQYFDLSLKKWVTKTMVTYDGKTTTTKTSFTENSDDIAKVDLVASKMKKTTVKFAYNIKVTNEGELPGYAYEVKDYIPKGLKFVAEDNKDWKELEDGTVVTEKLKDTLLNPGESATVEIILTWKNSTTNTGLKTNYAEISKDSADDIDSTPDNFNLKEDDIDDAQVILSIKTAGPQTYVGLILLSVTILAGGIFLIKKYVIK